MTSADVAALASLAQAEAQRHEPRTPERRAAAHLWVSLVVPRAKSVASARSAVATFGEPVVQAAALELLHRLAVQIAAQTEQEQPA